MKVYCPKCNSERVVVTSTERRVSIDELARLVPDYYQVRRRRHQARCQDCGYQREWEDPAPNHPWLAAD